MFRLIIRTAKSMLSARKLFVLIGGIAFILFFHLYISSSYCPIVNERYNNLDKKKAQTGTQFLSLENIDPLELAELKKSWVKEYDEERQRNVESLSNYEPIKCIINDDYTINCLREKGSDENIFMPFSFIEKYFEVYGKLKRYDAEERFEFLQSYAQVVYDPANKYTSNGVFMTFDTYNVEIRDRVKCITGPEGVPISTQWGSQGYFYPIQIAQYALSHFSKNIKEKPSRTTVYEDAEKNVHAGWKVTNRHCNVENVADPRDESNRVIKFSTPEDLPPGNGVSLTLGNTMEYSLSFDIKLKTNGSITVVIETAEERKGKSYFIHYVTNGCFNRCTLPCKVEKKHLGIYYLADVIQKDAACRQSAKDHDYEYCNV